MKALLFKKVDYFRMLILLIPGLISGQQISVGLDHDHLSMSMRFQADSTLHVKATYAVERTETDIYFLLNPGYQLERIESDGLKSYEMAMKENRPFPFYKLSYDENSADDGPDEVYFEYTIDLKSSNYINENWLEFNVDQLWFPKYNDLDTEFTWDLTIENLYAGYSLVSYSFDDRARYRVDMDPVSSLKLKQNQPTPEIYLMLGKDMQLWSDRSSTEGVAVEFFAHKDISLEILTSMDQKTDHIIQYFNTGFGQPDPIQRYLLVLRNTDKIGFLQSRGEILLANADSDNYAALSHEVAHYWWSMADFMNEPWMNEAFANYSMFLALEEFDNSSLTKQLNRSQELAANTGSVRAAGTFPPSNYSTYYHKGSLLLWELDQAIGRKAMLKLLHSRVDAGTNSTEAFLNLLEEQEGTQIRLEFESKL